jgi:branched-chain amino acid transport system permease protein
MTGKGNDAMKRDRSTYIFYCILGVALLLLPLVIKNTFYRMIFDQTLINIIAVIGLNFITGLIGETNLGMAGIFACGAYTSALLTTQLHVSPWLSLICAIIMGLCIGVILGWPSLRVRGIYLALTTIGFCEIVRMLLTNMAGITGGTQGVRNIPHYNFWGMMIDNEHKFYYFLLLIVIILALTALRIMHSKWGRACLAIKDNSQAVESCGIDIAKIKVIAFTLSAVYGCIGGALYAHLMGYINPADFNLDLSFKYLMMLMVGGLGSVPGSVLGAAVITLVPEYMRFLKEYYWLVFSVFTLIFVIFVPNGLISVCKNPFKPAKGGR